MSDLSSIIGEHEARIRSLETERAEHREDVVRLFMKLEEIGQDVAVLKNQHCPDPSACLRVEKAHTELSRRLNILEMSEQRKIGIVTAATAIGAVVGWLINLFFGKH